MYGVPELARGSARAPWAIIPGDHGRLLRFIDIVMTNRFLLLHPESSQRGRDIIVINIVALALLVVQELTSGSGLIESYVATDCDRALIGVDQEVPLVVWGEADVDSDCASLCHLVLSPRLGDELICYAAEHSQVSNVRPYAMPHFVFCARSVPWNIGVCSIPHAQRMQ